MNAIDVKFGLQGMGNRFIDIRKELGLKQTQLAKILKASEGSLSEIEAGIRDAVLALAQEYFYTNERPLQMNINKQESKSG